MIELKLFFQFNNYSYCIGVIRTLPKKIEMFYHFPWGSRAPSEFQKVGEENIKSGYLPDHKSFHADGRIHAKIRDERGKPLHIEPVDCKMNLFNLQEYNYLPIYLESFDLTNQDYVRKRFKIETLPDDSGLIWNVSDVEHCSLLLISKCARLNPELMVNSEGLNKLHVIDEALVIQKFFTKEEKDNLPKGSVSEFDTELTLMVIRQTIPKGDPIYDEKHGLGINYNTSRYIPSIHFLNQLVDINKIKNDPTL